jgi:rhodanese-related sulfurtransferase
MNRSKWIIWAVALVTVVGATVAIAGCTPAPGDVGNAQFEQLMKSGVHIVDVRTEAEFAGGYIEGAENVPLSEFEAAAATWDKTEPIALYCATGSRSVEAAQYLRSLGFEKVYNLTAGIVAWDGAIAGGATGVASSGGTPSASGLPVMYEFYTDW